MKLFEDLTQDEILDVASQRLEAEIDKQNNIARNIDSYINSHSIIKQQADLFKKWVSLDYQASEAMESVNADYYYTHIQKENFAYHTTKLIEEILENEDEDSATAIATRIIYKCQLQNNGKIEVENLIGKIYDIEESIIDNYDFMFRHNQTFIL